MKQDEEYNSGLFTGVGITLLLALIGLLYLGKTTDAVIKEQRQHIEQLDSMLLESCKPPLYDTITIQVFKHDTIWVEYDNSFRNSMRGD